MNQDHFGERHTWNGQPFICVTDEEAALKRKNNNVVDISWDNNTTETLVYVPVEDLPGRALPNEHVVFDNKSMKIMQVQEDMGMYSILLVNFDPKRIAL
jgi:hypothetical protein